MKNSFFFSAILFLLLFSSCHVLTYTPSASTIVSKRTINKSVLVETFIDKTNIKEREKRYLDLTYTAPEVYSKYEFENEITNSFVDDFSKNFVFEKIGLRSENPELIIRGEINDFTARINATVFQKVCLTSLAGFIVPYIIPSQLFALPVSDKFIIDIDITLYVYKSNGDLINTYNGKYNMSKYKNMFQRASQGYQFPSFIDSGLSDVIMQIRDKIDQDYSKISE